MRKMQIDSAVTGAGQEDPWYRLSATTLASAGLFGSILVVAEILAVVQVAKINPRPFPQLHDAVSFDLELQQQTQLPHSVASLALVLLYVLFWLQAMSSETHCSNVVSAVPIPKRRRCQFLSLQVVSVTSFNRQILGIWSPFS